MRIDGFWRGIFLDHHPVGVAVDGHVVFRQVSIVQAIAFNAFLTGPFFKLLQVLTQTVSKIFRQHRRLAAFALRQVIILLYAVQRAVLGFKLFVGAQLQAA